MIALIIGSVVIGLILSSVTGFSIVGLIVGIAFFICGLPFALASDTIHSEVKYAQDRADYRQAMHDIDEEYRWKIAQINEDARVDRMIHEQKKRKPSSTIIQDNRQIHIHRDKK